jgi:hypothetical protein
MGRVAKRRVEKKGVGGFESNSETTGSIKKRQRKTFKEIKKVKKKQEQEKRIIEK